MRLRILCFTIISLLDQAVPAYELPVRVKLNNDYLQTEVKVESVDGRIYVPIEPFAQAFGAKVEWVKENQEAQITAGDRQIMISPEGAKVVVADSEQVIDINTLYKDSTLKVGLTAFVEIFGASVTWDQSQRTAQVIDATAKLDSLFVAPQKFSEKDLMTLARLVHAESKGGSLDHNLAVANVIMNRVKSGKFPRTIAGVVYQPGQFPPAHRSGFKKIKPSPSCIFAARLSLEGENNVGKSLYFNNAPFKWKPKSSLYTVIQGQYFYL